MGSLNNPICGVKNVNIKKEKNKTIKNIIEILGLQEKSEIIILYEKYSPIIAANIKVTIFKTAKLVPSIPVYV